MTAFAPIAVCCLVAAALVVAWPAIDRRDRRIAVVTRAPARVPIWRPTIGRILGSAVPAPASAILVVAGAVAAVAAVVGGPVAAVGAGAYGAVGLHGWRRRARGRFAAAERTRRLDELSALAADLRAGLSAATAGRAAAPTTGGGSRDRLAELTAAACRLADQTGAPLADLLERIEADARAADRAHAAAAAQAAGAGATALLLAALPAAGIGLGYGLGVDPLEVLLHTPLGAACAVAAIVLQIGGLTWSRRLTRIEPGG